MNTNNQTPRRKRSSRQSRLAMASQWISNYQGNNIIKGYSTCFGVDKLCAIKELQMLGVKISEERKKQIVDAHEAMTELRKKKKEDKDEKEDNYGMLFGSDENFSFIAGYTSGGMPYGTAREEPDEKITEEPDDFF